MQIVKIIFYICINKLVNKNKGLDMKKIIYILLLLVSFNVSFSKDNFNLTPLSISYNGAVAKDSTIIFYGDYGTCKISKDNGETWEFKKIFEKGIIAKIFWEDNNITAFTRDGNIKKSTNNGNTWLEFPKITLKEDDDWLEFFIRIENNYLCRSLNNLYLIGKDLKLEKVVENKIKFSQFESNFLNSSNPLTLFKDKIYSIIDTSNINIYDKDCNFIKNVNIRETFNLNSSFLTFQIFSYTENLILKESKNFYKTNEKFDEFIIIDSINTYSDYQIYNNELYINVSGTVYKYHNEKINKINYLKSNTYKNFFKISFAAIKFLIHNDNIYYFRNNNYLFKTKLIDSINFSLKISDNDLLTKEYLELQQIKTKNKILAFSKENNFYNINFGEIDKNNDKIDLKINRQVKGQNQLYINNLFQIFYYDEIDDKLILCSNKGSDASYFFVSENFGQNFKSIIVKTDFDKFPKSIIFDNLIDGNMLRIGSDYYITTFFRSSLTAKYYSNIYMTNFEFEQTFGVQFENQQFLQSKIADSLSYDILSIDKTTNKIFYNSTTDKGENWEVYKEYPNTTNLLGSKELEFNGKKIWAYTYYDIVTSQFNLDVIDVEERKIYNVYQSQLTQDQIDSIDYIGFDAAKEKFYLSFYNTLMVSSNIFDQTPKWETFNYPNNGKVNKKFQIFDKTIFSRYEDDKNEDNVYWINGIEMVGDPTSVENIEEVSYLYTMPPYPNPTVSEVTAKFYWDSRIDIDNSEIGVFDITGNKVSGKENLSIEKLNEWSGNIKWNCVGQPKGTYLIKIQHGNNTKTVKVVVN